MSTEGAGAPDGAITCALADDHPAVLAAVSAYLEQEGIAVLATARTGDELLETLRQQRPTVALLDLRMPGMATGELISKATMVAPTTAFIVYTGYATPGALAEALDAGARGVIAKDAPLPDLVRAIHHVAGGGRYIDAVFSGAAQGTDVSLTARERDVLRLLADGLSNEEAAKRLYISPETVRTHLQKSMAKLNARTRVEAVATALRRSLIS